MAAERWQQQRVEQKLRCTKEPYVDDDGTHRIKSMRFSTLSGGEVRKSAEAQVWTSRIYGEDRKPIPGGLLDTRMGAANKFGECATCHGSYTECPGHFGYIKLALPVFNVGFFNSIVNVLKCICKRCSRVLLSEKDRQEFLKKMRNPRAEVLHKSAILSKVRDKCRPCRCHWCGYMNGITKKGPKDRGGLAIVHDCSKTLDGTTEELRSALSHKKEKLSFPSVHLLDPQTVLALFTRMTDEDCELLNLGDRSEKLIITEIAVPPVPIRPSVFVGGSTMSNEDSITCILKNIVAANQIIKEALNKGESPVNCFNSWQDLQLQVIEYINSDAPCLSDSQHRGLMQRLKGKTGRFRGNLSGKRTEYTGRTVISPDPNLKITEVAIPVLMARVLTYPERVSYYNIEKLRQCIRNGPNKHPGANFIIQPDGTKLHLKYADRRIAARDLNYGCIVERHLEDGDIVLFNRQPSLHRMSIMSHRARIMPWRTLRFNESVCNPYNADFDGDEMNLHVPQTEEARTEAFMLMGPIELWTGKQLFSVLVRPNACTKVFLNLTVEEKIYMKLKERDKKAITVLEETMCPNDGFVYFRNSELLCGQVGKKTLGNGNNEGMFSVLIRDYNSHAAASCMNRLAKFSARFIGNHGFSIGVDDVQPGGSLNQKKKITIDEGYEKCHELIALYSKGDLIPQPGCNRAQTLESQISCVLNKLRETAGDDCMSTLHWRNSPLIMSQCGSKGSPINISQMVVCVGQQSVGGRRAPNGFIDRTLPHFPINSKTPAAKGFVANSFYTGLTPTEFFFHTMGGREGLVDTAVKTAETGYMSRRLMKGLEDLSVFYDQTVRNASGGIVQFVYGDDGMDPVKMEGKGGRPLNLDQLYRKVMATCPQRGDDTLSPELILQMFNDKLSEQDASSGGCSDKFKEMLTKFFEDRIKILRSTRRALQLDEDRVGKRDSSIEERIAADISGVSAKQLQVFLDTCLSRYHSKIIEAGASIGAIGAQSIGEPGTQMTLKTFHFAGVASMNVTLGVPRIKEIINAVKKISTPIITTELLSEQDELFAAKVKCSIEKVVLGEVAAAIKIVLKSNQPYLVVKLDTQGMERYMGISSDTVQLSILNHAKTKLKSEGIPTVERAVVNPVLRRDGSFDRYNLLVEGTNLLKVLGTPGVDAKRTKSNHILEVNQTLGIEAARRSIIDEIQYTFENNNMMIDLRHMMLLADLMTYKGEILGITASGIAKMKSSVLMLSSFERASEHLFNASYTGREDQIEGVSECIIMGIPMQLGTGILRVRQRLQDLPEFKYQPDPIPL
ncbi:hypothetical protein ZWY2020_058565 [Hordeum vulgare]|nr:hypothetical protein ZWY2020_058565 [Hordeum vulgare]